MSKRGTGSWIALLLLGFAAAVFVGGCKEEGPAEKVGESIDDAAEEVGDAVEDATDG